MRKGKILILLLGILLITALFVAGCGGGQAEEPKEDQQQQAEEPKADEQQADKQEGQKEEAAEEPAEQDKEEAKEDSSKEEGKMVYVSSDEKPEGCVSCHTKVSEEKDYSLTAELTAMSDEFGHPKMDIQGPEQCQMCHPDGEISFDKVAHKIHLTGGEENHFITSYEGSCLQCHALTDENEMVVKGLAKDAELQVIKAASLDLETESCGTCHQNDYSLTNELTKMNEEFGHPKMEISSGEDCLMCHKPDGNMPLDKVLHEVHLTGEENHFVANYGGSCLNCHVLNDSGKMTTKL